MHHLRQAARDCFTMLEACAGEAGVAEEARRSREASARLSTAEGPVRLFCVVKGLPVGGRAFFVKHCMKSHFQAVLRSAIRLASSVCCICLLYTSDAAD